ncbi:MAG TPA: hypothetical protein VMQ52_03245 [Candidatus Saccharimonadales bacterium]|jgi:hypothetical protein|nr:hypothetical protein [Candidatus Saccharimonadales bacterium]
MKIFICCSKAFYDKVTNIKSQLESAGNIVTLPNSFDNPGREDEMRAAGAKKHSTWKAEMLHLQEQKVKNNDAILLITKRMDS